MANRVRTQNALPLSAQDSLQRMGASLRIARKRRHMTIADLAVRVAADAKTISKLEHGHPGVGIGILASVLDVFGMDSLEKSVAPEQDKTGIALSNLDLLRKKGRAVSTNLDF